MRDVETAKAALQPPMVGRRGRALPRKRRFDRRNEAFLRQGEWFFVPAPELRVDRGTSVATSRWPARVGRRTSCARRSAAVARRCTSAGARVVSAAVCARMSRA